MKVNLTGRIFFSSPLHCASCSAHHSEHYVIQSERRLDLYLAARQMQNSPEDFCSGGVLEAYEIFVQNRIWQLSVVNQSRKNLKIRYFTSSRLLYWKNMRRNKHFRNLHWEICESCREFLPVESPRMRSVQDAIEYGARKLPHKEIRGNQKEVIEAYLAGRDVLVA